MNEKSSREISIFSCFRKKAKKEKKLGKEKEIEEKLEHESSFHFPPFKERHFTASRVYH